MGSLIGLTQYIYRGTLIAWLTHPYDCITAIYHNLLSLTISGPAVVITSFMIRIRNHEVDGIHTKALAM